MLEAKFVEALCLYDWPLNVRELSHLVRRLIELHGDELTLKKRHLPARIVERIGNATGDSQADYDKRGWHRTKLRTKSDSKLSWRL